MKRALLIPGIGGTTDCWNALFTGRLKSGFTVETVELPGEAMTIEEMARGFALSPPPYIIIGFSIGAAVVQEMLVSPLTGVSRAVLMAPPAGKSFPGPPERAHDFSDGRGKWSASMLEMMFTPEWLAANPDVTEYFPRVKRSVPGDRLEAQSRAIYHWDGLIHRLGKVHTPVLILAGLYDIITPVVHARAIHEAMPCSRITVMETGHGFPWQCPVETADAILEFAL